LRDFYEIRLGPNHCPLRMTIYLFRRFIGYWRWTLFLLFISLNNILTLYVSRDQKRVLALHGTQDDRYARPAWKVRYTSAATAQRCERSEFCDGLLRHQKTRLLRCSSYGEAKITSRATRFLEMMCHAYRSYECFELVRHRRKHLWCCLAS
jgi:hypothetical protein